MITVYGKQGCVYCDRTKTLLDDNDVDYCYYDITHRKDTLESLLAETKAFNHRTYPFVFRDGKPREFIGGFTELESMLHAGLLTMELNENF